MSELFIKKIRVTNARCVKEAVLNFGPKVPGQGQFEEIVGENAAGKTTLKEMIDKIWRGGKDPTLVRNGADVAEGSILLSDGHLSVRTHTRTESTLTIIGPEGVKVEGGPVTWLKRLGPWFSRDPVAFDDADPKKRLEMLLEMATDVTFEPAEIGKCLGREVAKTIPAPADVIDLKEFGKFHQSVVDRRAATGRQQKEKAGFIETLRKTLVAPEGAPVDWAARLAEVERQIAAIAKTEDSEISAIGRAAAVKRLELNADIRKLDDKAQSDFATMLASARSGDTNNPEWDEDEPAVMATLRMLASRYQALNLLNEGEAESVQAAKDRASAAREALAAAKAEARAGADTQLREQGTLAGIDKTTTECQALSALYDSLDNAAHALDKLRKSKVDKALLKGMEVRADGLIYMNGIDWDAENTATRLFNSIALCTRATGDIWDGFVCIDGGERFGPKRKEEIRQAVIRSGVQAVMFTVASPEWIAEHGPDMQSVRGGFLTVAK
jgi:hypothetical protein